MKNTAKTLIESRTSIGRYDPNQDIDDVQLNELVRLATLAPTAYNLQNWTFIAVRSKQKKTALQKHAFNQPQVVAASITIIVCGVLAAHQNHAQALQPSLDAGIMDQAGVQAWVDASTADHQDNPQKQRDEAIRSASLAAMTLMIAAQGMGIASGAMGGFDANGIAQEFALKETELPVMLLTLGYPKKGNWPQKKRLPVEQVLLTV